MKDCVYDLTINDTWIMQSLYHSNKKFGERKSHIEKLFFRGTKVVQYPFYAKKRFTHRRVRHFLLISVIDELKLHLTR